MSRRKVVIAVVLLLAALTLALAVIMQRREYAPRPAALLPKLCSELVFEDDAFVICAVDPSFYSIELYLNDRAGQAWRSIDRLAKSKRDGGRPLLFAMNAGMYHDDLSPVGLFIANRQRVAPLQSGNGDGNFFMKPNGVFGVFSDGKPFVVTTESFHVSPRITEFATQSGPMLLIDGELNRAFEPDGQSRFVRNGVGVTEDGQAIFAISREPVSFGKFGRLFRDRLECRNALYFDGVVSTLYGKDSTIIGGGYPAGPIVAVFPR